MISERDLAQYFHSFWQEQFPLLNPSFIRNFNVQDRKRVHTKEGEPIKPLLPSKAVERFDLVAELAFEWAFEELLSATADRETATQRTLERIALLQGTSEILAPTAFEITEANLLTETYRHFYKTVVGEHSIRFRPLIRGLGILNQMEGDFCSEDTLFEVKTVNRNLLSTDLRQVITYVIAGNYSREYTWKRYCIFNPRQAVYFIGYIDELIEYLSGRSPSECTNSIVDVLLEREQPLETRF